MIIVKLMGGLGNQMFQYATARALAIRRNTNLKIDLSFLQRQNKVDTPRVYELHNFNIQESFAESLEVAMFNKKGRNIWENALVRLRRTFSLTNSKPRILRESHFHFDSSILNSPDNVYLEGYWQSEKYFSDCADTIKDEFTMKGELSEQSKELSKIINNSNSVSIHVRRGDYVTNPVTNSYHGVCGLDYYDAAFKEIGKHVSDPHLFVFSDDFAWVEKNLAAPFPATHVIHNGPFNGCEDMCLMSLCKHNIIANSSFSWWGAWLNRNPNKIVIAPRKWFNDSEICTDELIPANWVRL